MNEDQDLCLCPFRKERCEVIKDQSQLDILPAPDACRACCDTSTPIRGFPNHVTTSLSLKGLRDKVSPSALQAFKDEWGHLLRTVEPEIYDGSGPGTELKKLLAKAGLQPCNHCLWYARKMDSEGCDWCAENVEVILDWLAANAKRRGFPFVRAVARPLVFRAIHKARGQEMKDMRNVFERVFCVNLRNRTDRWQQFLDRFPDWPFAPIERFDAINGKLCKPPQWWTQGPGAWGCYRSHLAILERCINDGVRSVLFLEDDALPCEDFHRKVGEFIRNVPKDWGMLYLGGQHLYVNQNPPKKVNDKVFIPWNVNRTHAFALQGKMMEIVYRHLCRIDWNRGHHIDHHLGRLHQQRNHPIYCPHEWLVGQAEGKSNISGRETPDRFWQSAETIAAVDPEAEPFVAVLGLHSSGSSCLAGVLYHLGLHLGNNLGGYYGKDPEKGCGFEAVGLAQICEGAIPFPAKEYKWKRGQIWSHLKQWINDRRREAAQAQTIAAGKYPQLCRMGTQLRNLCGDRLRIIAIDRPLEESIESLIRRSGKTHDPAALKAHQEWLWAGREQTLADINPDQVLRVSYGDLLEDPRGQVHRIIDFLGYEPLEGRIDKAVEYVQPEKRHIILGKVES